MGGKDRGRKGEMERGEDELHDGDTVIKLQILMVSLQ